MGKKVKIGKARKDKFYHLAKETGYRARSAFKLLQLNRKFSFLGKSRVCVDLCAAPGGWMQVAAKEMPVSSLIVGVDLVPIKPIPGCISFCEDITTEKCRSKLRKELQTWKADVVMNDGAPNVGKNWLHDAFMQAELTLAAMKLSTEFLKKGGWFITKVFRSKDYHALMWVFNQLFRKVHATKPQASRNESAEIFVVCQGYHAPDKLDPKFTDPKYVFQEANVSAKPVLNLIHPEKDKKKAEGYDDDDFTLHHKLSASEFIKSENFMDLLATTNQIVLDDQLVAGHEKTTVEIKACCEDIRVLGKKEIRGLLSWRKAMIKALEKKAKEGEDKEDEEDEASGNEAEMASDEDDEEEGSEEEMEEGEESEEEGEEAEDGDKEADEKELEEKLSKMKEDEKRDLKKKRKKVLKEKRKLRDKMALNMVLPGDNLDITDDISLFDLKKIKSKNQLKKVEVEDMEGAALPEEEEDDEEKQRQHKMMLAYDRYKSEGVAEDMGPESSSDEEGEDGGEGSELEFETGSEGDEEEEEEAASEEEEEEEEEEEAEQSANPLVVDMEGQDAKSSKRMQMWFKKDAFEGLESEGDEDLEIEHMAEDYVSRGGEVLGKKTKKENEKADDKKEKKTKEEKKKEKKKKQVTIKEPEKAEAEEEESDSDSSDSGASDSEDDGLGVSGVNGVSGGRGDAGSRRDGKKDGFEVVPLGDAGSKRVRKLDPTGLAIGEELIKSKKRRREIEEMGFHRFTFNDAGLPDWFVTDERRHQQRPQPVTKEQVDYYRERQRAIDARPIKKVAEAKSRKHRKMVKKLERARKRADAVSDTVDTSDREKWSKIKEIYKRAGLTKKKTESMTYVVAKKGTGKRVSRPAGVKGRFKVVDPRQKKDDRARKASDKKERKGKGQKKGKKSR